MPIRDVSSKKSQNAAKVDPQVAFEGIQKDLHKAVADGTGRAERLSEKEARSLIGRARASGPEVVKLLKAELTEALALGGLLKSELELIRSLGRPEFALADKLQDKRRGDANKRGLARYRAIRTLIE